MDKKTFERFMSKVTVSPSGCWLWSASCFRDGYGQFSVSEGGIRKNYRAHRISWHHHYGEIQENMYVCHRCDVPACVNPSHLFLGTASENARDRDNKGRARISRGEMNSAAKLTRSDVEKIRSMRGTLIQREIGAMFGVHQTLVGKILRMENWK